MFCKSDQLLIIKVLLPAITDTYLAKSREINPVMYLAKSSEITYLFISWNIA